MVYGLWQSAAGLQAQDYRQAIIANNLANVDTPGFKPDRISFAERMSAAKAGAPRSTRHPVLDALPGGLFETPVHTDYSQAAIETTSSPLDVAIEGSGFLTVQTPDGPRYTRDGRLTLNRDGELRHASSGYPVVDGDGKAIVLDASQPRLIKIDEQGQVKQGERAAGRLALVDFNDRSGIKKVGQNLFAADRARPTNASGTVRQFATEGSGADPVTSLVEMIDATRAYQLNATMLTMQDESLGRLVNEVGKIG
jgi:flagellar basal-body rod protein FlgF